MALCQLPVSSHLGHFQYLGANDKSIKKKSDKHLYDSIQSLIHALDNYGIVFRFYFHQIYKDRGRKYS